MPTKIEWTNETWNPVTGCTKCSAGCEHCYAARMAKRLQAMGCKRYSSGFDVTVHRDLFERPFSWRKSRMVFVNSMSDLFHDGVPDDDICELFEVMNQLPQHIFQVLTKRSERLQELDSKLSWTPNIWMGVTIENRASLERAYHLKSTGAHVKFVSAEPLLESIRPLNLQGIDWLIVGGESGPGCRPMEPSWAIELLDSAREASVPFFFKQWGGFRRCRDGHLLNGNVIQEFPANNLMS